MWRAVGVIGPQARFCAARKPWPGGRHAASERAGVALSSLNNGMRVSRPIRRQAKSKTVASSGSRFGTGNNCVAAQDNTAVCIGKHIYIQFTANVPEWLSDLEK